MPRPADNSVRADLPVERPRPRTQPPRPRGWLGFGLLLAALGLAAAVGLAGSPDRPVQAAVTWPTVGLTTVVAGLTSPVHVTNAGDGTNRLFIVDQTGVIRIYQSGSLSTFLDIHTRVLSGGERGLLSVAFPANYAAKQYFYVYYTSQPNGDVTLSRFHVPSGTANVANPASEEIILSQVHPEGNHNGGQLAFNPADGYLYMGLGDGGGGNDQHGVIGNGQDLTTWLGKLLRLDTESNGPNGGYIVPPTNPFTSTVGVKPEIWAYGVRNPWRFSFDRQTRDLYVGDVGQGAWEEVDFQPAGFAGGANYGWRNYEGNHCTAGVTCPGAGTPTPTPPARYVGPVWEYDHGSTGGCAIVGGFVYRGSLSPALRGIYFYGDNCSGRIWGLQRDNNGTGPWVNQELVPSGAGEFSFGEDEAGEVYVLRGSTLYRLTDATASPVTVGSPTFITPVRILDTRATAPGITTTGFDPGSLTTISPGPIQASVARRFQVAGRTFSGITVPTNTTGLILNVTGIQGGASGGFLTVYAGDLASPPNASTLNPSTATAFNFWETALPSSGQLAVYSTNRTDVAIDLVGYYTPTPGSAGTLQFITPLRVLDTRPPGNGIVTTGFNADGTNSAVTAAPIPAGQTRKYRLAGQTFGGVTVPNDVSGVLANVTVVQAGGGSGGFVTMFPGNLATPPNVSTVNPVTGIDQNFWGMAIPTSGADAGAFSIFTTNTLDVAVDVVGYYRTGAVTGVGNLTLISPVRAVDTRPNGTGITTTGFDETGAAITAAPLQANVTRRVTFAGQSFGGQAIPSDAKAVLVNVTTIQGGGTGGFVTVFPGDATAPNASTVNPSTAIAFNFWGTGLATGANSPGTAAVRSTNALDLAIDLIGYYR